MEPHGSTTRTKHGVLQRRPCSCRVSPGGAVFLLWPLACVGMMVAMLWGMRGMGKPAQHSHPDGVTHSHDEALTPSGR